MQAKHVRSNHERLYFDTFKPLSYLVRVSQIVKWTFIANTRKIFSLYRVLLLSMTTGCYKSKFCDEISKEFYYFHYRNLEHAKEPQVQRVNQRRTRNHFTKIVKRIRNVLKTNNQNSLKKNIKNQRLQRIHIKRYGAILH